MWLKLYSYTFLIVRHNEGLLYNAADKLFYIFECKGLVKDICQKLSRVEYLYCIELNNNLLKQDMDLFSWVRKVEEGHFGEVVVEEHNNIVPSLPPFLIMDKNKEREQALSLIYDIYFYIGGDAPFYYNDYNKQIPIPICSDKLLSLTKVQNFLTNIYGYNLQNIYFLLEDLSCLYELCAVIDNIPLGITVKLITSNVKIFNCDISWRTNTMFSFICLTIEDLNAIYSNTQHFSNVEYYVLIQNELDLEIALRAKYSNLRIYPYYNGNNLSFFEKYVYIDEKGILENKLKKKDIFINQVCNSNFFGKLFVMPNGEIQGSNHSSMIGNIDDSIYQILEKLLLPTSPWMQIRDVGKCKECIFQFFCPPISNYEFALEKFELCYKNLSINKI